MKVFYIPLFAILLLMTFKPEEIGAQSWKRYAKENCKYKCYLQKREYLGLDERKVPIFKETITDTLLLDTDFYKNFNETEADKFSSVTLHVYDTLTQKIGIKNKSIELYLVDLAYISYGDEKQTATDYPAYKLIKYDNKYAITAELSSKDFTVFNLLSKSLDKIKLDTREKVLQYVDFMLRFYYMPTLEYYRVNKPEDIWIYPQFINYVYVYPGHNYVPDGVKRFNREMMVEHVPLEGDYKYKDMKKFKAYRKYIDTLKTLIKPAEVVIKNNEISVTTYMGSYRLNEDIELWKIRLKTDGTIIDYDRQTVLKNAGFDYYYWFWGEEPTEEPIFPMINWRAK